MNAVIVTLIMSVISALIYDVLKSRFLIKFGRLIFDYLTSLHKKIKPSIFAPSYKLKQRLQDVMTPKSVFIKEDNTIDQAFNVLDETGEWCLSVESGRLDFIGVVFKDKLADAKRKGFGSKSVTTEMLPKEMVVHFHASDTVGKALKTLRENNAVRAPVTLNGRVRGFITLEDIEKYVEIKELGSQLDY